MHTRHAGAGLLVKVKLTGCCEDCNHSIFINSWTPRAHDAACVVLNSIEPAVTITMMQVSVTTSQACCEHVRPCTTRAAGHGHVSVTERRPEGMVVSTRQRKPKRTKHVVNKQGVANVQKCCCHCALPLTPSLGAWKPTTTVASISQE